MIMISRTCHNMLGLFQQTTKINNNGVTITNKQQRQFDCALLPLPVKSVLFAAVLCLSFVVVVLLLILLVVVVLVVVLVVVVLVIVVAVAVNVAVVVVLLLLFVVVVAVAVVVFGNCACVSCCLPSFIF